MAAVGLAAALAQARILVAALVPATGAHRFVLAAVNVAVDVTPAVRERVFDVVPAESPSTIRPLMRAPDGAEYQGAFSVRIRYDLKQDHVAAHARINEDAEQIAFALAKSSSYAAGTEYVELAGGSVVRSDAYLLSVLNFSCVFLRSF